MNEEKNTSESDAPSVDLGEDLLEKTAVFIRPSHSTSFSPPSPSDSSSSLENLETSSLGTPFGETISGERLSTDKIADYLENAKILLNEGFSDDAKKFLHKILIVDPDNAVSQSMLAEIRELELKQIFGEVEDRQSYKSHLKSEEKPQILEVDTETLLERLDQDFDLNLSNSESLFENSESLHSFYHRVESDLIKVTASIQDWVDLGIAFLEMGLYSVSVKLLNQVCRRFDLETEIGKQDFLSATSLLALALLLDGKPYEVIQKIQPLLRNTEIQREKKIELFYLMGRCYEQIKKQDLAAYYYQEVVQLDSHYRDIDRRLRVV